MKIKVVYHVTLNNPDATYARFFAYDDEDNELYQCHRDVTREMQQAKRSKKSLASVLLRAEIKNPSFKPRGS